MPNITPQQIETWIARHFDYKVKSKGSQITINNPFDGDSGYHFWIGLELVKSKKRKELKPNYWVHDFRPGHKQWDSSFLKFVQNYKNISFFEAVKDVCGSGSTAMGILRQMRSAEHKEDEIEEEVITLPKDVRCITEQKDSIARKMALNYLKSRCIDEIAAVAYRICYNATSVVFPYIEYGMQVYWQRRDIIDKAFEFPIQTHNGPGKSDFLYGFDDVEPGSFIVVVESIFNKLVLAENVVASGGAGVSPRQVKKIKALNPDLIVLAPDNDEAGLISLRENFFELRSQNIKLAYCVPPKVGELNDWNDFDQEYGLGWSRSYIEKNTRKLSLSAVLRPWIGKNV